MLYRIRDRLKVLGRLQAALLPELEKRDLKVQPPNLSNMLNGRDTTPKAAKVVEACHEIVTNWERIEASFQ